MLRWRFRIPYSCGIRLAGYSMTSTKNDVGVSKVFVYDDTAGGVLPVRISFFAPSLVLGATTRPPGDRRAFRRTSAPLQ
jgi:hypothetical protein